MIAVIGLWEFFVLRDAVAGPPLEKMAAALTHTTNVNTGHTGIAQTPNTRLDLRPPTEFLVGTQAATSFPVSARHKLFEANDASHSEAAAAGSTANAASASSHIMSPMQTMAHNFRQEGLPVARLFENKDSLLHVGLNQKGKPGLWLIHKLH